MAEPLLTIIYVNFNSADLLLESLKSLEHKTHGLPYEVFVIDNSADVGLKKALDGRAKYLESKNKGFGAANNLGAKQATGQFLLFLNPDTLIKDDSIVKLVEYLRVHHEVGALSPLLYDNNGQLQRHFYGNFMSLWSITFGRLSNHHQKISNSPDNRQLITDHQIAFPTGMVSAACLMIKKELFNKIGGFDEKYFMYLEDDDLCRRLWRSGYQNRVLTSAKITHLEGRSSVSLDKNKWYYQSQDYYFRKHFGLLAMLVMKLIRWPYKTSKLSKD